MDTPFRKVGSDKLLSGKIEESIELAIRRKDYKAGEKLPTEGQLCDLFGVSRTVVREALRKLSARGLVVIKQGSGAYVNELSSESAIDSINLFLELTDDGSLIFDIIRARQLFEPEIAGLAALNRTAAELDELAGNLEALKASSMEDIDGQTIIDIRFHSLIASATHNNVVALLMRPIFDNMPKVKRSIYAKNNLGYLTHDKSMVLKFHEDIYEAIKNADPREASHAMLAHLKATEKNFKDSLE
ncbi:MAG: FadR family transcriptional regulator [Chitinophagaceae bacterium]|nr:FadR family transcriptional regulator [Chitinophagaceae bacterium]